MSNLPGVELEQIDVLPSGTLADTQLYPTTVAPLYRVVKNALALANAPFPEGGVTLINKITIHYPKVDPGAVIVLSSIVINIVSGIVEWLKPSTGAVGFVAGNDTLIDNNVDFIDAGVLAGDIVTVDYGTFKGSFPVLSVSQHSLQFTYPVYTTFTGTDAGYVITRNIVSSELSSSSYNATQTSIDIITAEYLSKTILSGEIRISYNALRKDKTGLIKYSNFDDVMADMEVDHIENKLGYYIKNAIIPANGNTTAFLVYILEDDTQDAYINALSDLIGHKEVYMLVPLSNDSTVKSTYASHVNVASAPEESAFRVLFTTVDITKTHVLASGSVPNYYYLG